MLLKINKPFFFILCFNKFPFIIYKSKKYLLNISSRKTKTNQQVSTAGFRTSKAKQPIETSRITQEYQAVVWKSDSVKVNVRNACGIRVPNNTYVIFKWQPDLYIIQIDKVEKVLKREKHNYYITLCYVKF